MTIIINEKYLQNPIIKKYAEESQTNKIFNAVTEDIYRKLFAKAREAVDYARNVGANIDELNEPRVLLENATVAYKNGDLSDSIQLLVFCQFASDEITNKRVTAVYDNFKRQLEEAEKKHKSIPKGREYLKKAEETLTDKKYKDALSFLMQSEGEIEKKFLQSKASEKTIADMEQNYSELKTLCENMETELKKIKETHSNGEYATVIESSVELNDKINKFYTEKSERHKKVEEEVALREEKRKREKAF